MQFSQRQEEAICSNTTDVQGVRETCHSATEAMNLNTHVQPLKVAQAANSVFLRLHRQNDEVSSRILLVASSTDKL